MISSTALNAPLSTTNRSNPGNSMGDETPLQYLPAQTICCFSSHQIRIRSISNSKRLKNHLTGPLIYSLMKESAAARQSSRECLSYQTMEDLELHLSISHSTEEFHRCYKAIFSSKLKMTEFGEILEKISIETH